MGVWNIKKKLFFSFPLSHSVFFGVGGSVSIITNNGEILWSWYMGSNIDCFSNCVHPMHALHYTFNFDSLCEWGDWYIMQFWSDSWNSWIYQPFNNNWLVYYPFVTIKLLGRVSIWEFSFVSTHDPSFFFFFFL